MSSHYMNAPNVSRERVAARDSLTVSESLGATMTDETSLPPGAVDIVQTESLYLDDSIASSIVSSEGPRWAAGAAPTYLHTTLPPPATVQKTATQNTQSTKRSPQSEATSPQTALAHRISSLEAALAAERATAARLQTRNAALQQQLSDCGHVSLRDELEKSALKIRQMTFQEKTLKAELAQAAGRVDYVQGLRARELAEYEKVRQHDASKLLTTPRTEVSEKHMKVRRQRSVASSSESSVSPSGSVSQVGSPQRVVVQSSRSSVSSSSPSCRGGSPRWVEQRETPKEVRTSASIPRHVFAVKSRGDVEVLARHLVARAQIDSEEAGGGVHSTQQVEALAANILYDYTTPHASPARGY